MRIIISRLNRFRHLQSDYNLHAEGLTEFLNDTQVIGNLERLSADRRLHSVRRKQDIYVAGDESIRLYFLKAGRVKTVKTTNAGKELLTGLYHPGEFFGYLALLPQTAYDDSAVALDNAALVYLPKYDFLRLLTRNAEVGQPFIRILAGCVSEREQQFWARTYHSICRRVADMLLGLHEDDPDTLIQLSRNDLAAMVGTASESLSRTLSEFRQAGYVELTPQGIRGVQPAKRRVANGHPMKNPDRDWKPCQGCDSR